MERARGEVDLGIWAIEPQAGRYDAALDAEHRLDESRDTGRGVEMADVGLHRPDRAVPRLRRRRSERPRERFDFNRVSDRRSGTMGLDEADRLGVDLGLRQGLQDRVGLARDARGGVADARRPFVVHADAPDDGVDPVAVLHGRVEPLEQDEADAVAGHCAAGVRVERAAAPIRRNGSALAEDVAGPLGQHDRHPTGNGHVALKRPKALAREGDRGQRRRAGCSDVQARTRQSETKRCLSRHVIRPVANQQAQRRLVTHEGRIGQDVLEKVWAQCRARKDADASRVRPRIVARRLEQLPCALKKEPLLRIHQRRVLRRHAEERRVEELDAVENAARPDVPGIANQVGRDALAAKIIFAEGGDGLDTAAQVGPEGFDSVGAWRADDEAGDRDLAGVRLNGDRHADSSGGGCLTGPVCAVAPGS